MNTRSIGFCIAGALLFGLGHAALAQVPTPRAAGPIDPGDVPQRKHAAPLPPRGTYEPPRTSWGDPDIAGAYNNNDESGIPFERPDDYAGRDEPDALVRELLRRELPRLAALPEEDFPT